MVDLNGHEAGNGGHSQGKPIVYRDSSTRRDVVNLNSSGTIQCETSTLHPDVLQDTLAVGFSGQIPTDCATSFTAPCVSWLFAYVEATRNCKSDKNTRFLGLQHRL
jgi:hypothetical protein